MSIIGRSLEKLDGRLNAFTLEVFAKILTKTLITEALKICGRSSRRVRKLPDVFVVWLVIAMGLFRGRSIQNVLSRIEGHPMTSEIN